MAATIAPYGSWQSPITARQIAQGTIGLGEVLLEGPYVYWVEMRPAEGGWCVVVRRDPDGALVEMTPQGFNARTRVHEYGGGAYLPCGNTVAFVNFADQQVYRYLGSGEPAQITLEENARYADLICDATRRRLIAVREDHSGEGEAVNTIAAIYPHAPARPVEVLVSGHDFFAAPRVSPDGRRLAWLAWDHPDMPWDAARLYLAPIAEDGAIGDAALVAGGPEEAAAQPLWSPDNVLYFASDRTDWWNLYRWNDGQVEQVTDLAAEFVTPHWVFRKTTCAFESADRMICAFTRDGLWRLATLDVRTNTLTEIETPFTSIAYVSAGGGRAAFVGGAPDAPASVVLVDLETWHIETLRRATDIAIEAGCLSAPEPVTFPTEGGKEAHGLFYAPRNNDCAAPPDEKPPLVVMVHGGPTSATRASLRLGIQYYTSRGIAVLDVNYGGSTGYGRRYRERLYGLWGVVDVDDACNAAKHLAEEGRVDGARLAITGGSAGGYTTLSALAFRDTFAAGASHFGVSDCELLAKETHKFESRYLDRLIGPYPERRDLYVERSPIHHVDGLSCPVVFFQGLEDKIVPPNQARILADALRKKGLPVALVEFEGEQHGFRKAESIERALEWELAFFARVFGFTPADEIPPLAIDNRPEGA